MRSGPVRIVIPMTDAERRPFGRVKYKAEELMDEVQSLVSFGMQEAWKGPDAILPNASKANIAELLHRCETPEDFNRAAAIALVVSNLRNIKRHTVNDSLTAMIQAYVLRGCADSSDNRKCLHHVWREVDGDRTTFVGLDGKRMHYVEIPTRDEWKESCFVEAQDFSKEWGEDVGKFPDWRRIYPPDETESTWDGKLDLASCEYSYNKFQRGFVVGIGDSKFPLWYVMDLLVWHSSYGMSDIRVRTYGPSHPGLFYVDVPGSDVKQVVAKGLIQSFNPRVV